ncbi:MAG: hypothetical protein ACREIC_11020, partial [Limisphaerales bacterium]
GAASGATRAGACGTASTSASASLLCLQAECEAEAKSQEGTEVSESQCMLVVHSWFNEGEVR